MALNNNKELYIKRIKQILCYGGLLFLIIFNIIKFCDFTSSNPELLVEYKTPKDELQHFRNPLIATAYFDNFDNLKILLLPENIINHPFVKRKKIYKQNWDEILVVSKNDIIYEPFIRKFLKNSNININKISLSDNISFNIKNKLVIFFNNVENQSEELQIIKNYAKKHNLTPKTFDLLDIKKGYNFLNPKPKNKTSSLDEQQKNLESFVKDYNLELKNFIANPKEKTNLSRHFYDKVSSIVLACNTDKSICEEFGNFNFEKSLKSSLIQNLQQATEKYPDYEKKIYLLTNLEKQKFANEAEFSDSLDTSIGVLLTIGFRQAIMLPTFWKKYQNNQDFIKDLKIKSGLNPDYWNNDINIYYFKVVEI